MCAIGWYARVDTETSVVSLSGLVAFSSGREKDLCIIHSSEARGESHVPCVSISFVHTPLQTYKFARDLCHRAQAAYILLKRMSSSLPFTSKNIPAPAGWGDDVPTVRPSSPANLSRDGFLINDLDRSFGSSMSISSLDSPHRSVRRARASTQSAIGVHLDDPFAVTADEGFLVPTSIPPTFAHVSSIPYRGVPDSSPHAMDISSPAVIMEPPAGKTPAAFRSIQPSSVSFLGRDSGTTRYSMPALGHYSNLMSRPSTPDSPDYGRPPKKRLASTSQLQDASFETDGPERCVFFDENKGRIPVQNKSRLHTRTQSVSTVHANRIRNCCGGKKQRWIGTQRMEKIPLLFHPQIRHTQTG